MVVGLGQLFGNTVWPKVLEVGKSGECAKMHDVAYFSMERETGFYCILVALTSFRLIVFLSNL